MLASAHFVDPPFVIGDCSWKSLPFKVYFLIQFLEPGVCQFIRLEYMYICVCLLSAVCNNF